MASARWKPYVNSTAAVDINGDAFDFAGNQINEYLHFYELGVDGLFSDFPDDAFAARELFALQNGAVEDEE